MWYLRSLELFGFKTCGAHQWSVEKTVSEFYFGIHADDHVLDLERGVLNYVRASKTNALLRFYKSPNFRMVKTNRLSVSEKLDIAPDIVPMSKKTNAKREPIRNDGSYYPFKLNGQHVLLTGVFEIGRYDRKKTFESGDRFGVFLKDSNVVYEEYVVSKSKELSERYATLNTDAFVACLSYDDFKKKQKGFGVDVRSDITFYEDLSTMMDLKLASAKIKDDAFYEKSKIKSDERFEESTRLAKDIVLELYTGKNTRYVEAVWLKFLGLYDANWFNQKIDLSDVDRKSFVVFRRLFMNERLRNIFENLDENKNEESVLNANITFFSNYVECMLNRLSNCIQKICKNDSYAYLGDVLKRLIQHRSEFLDLEEFDSLSFLSSRYEKNRKRDDETSTKKFETFLKDELLNTSYVPTDIAVVMVVVLLFKTDVVRVEGFESHRSKGACLLYETMLDILTSVSSLNVSSCYPDANEHVRKKIGKKPKTAEKTTYAEDDVIYDVRYDDLEYDYVKYNAYRRMRMRLHDVFGKQLTPVTPISFQEWVGELNDDYEPIVDFDESMERFCSDNPSPDYVDENMLTSNVYDDLTYCSAKLFGFKHYRKSFDYFGKCDTFYAVRIMLNAWCQSSVFDHENSENVRNYDVVRSVSIDDLSKSSQEEGRVFGLLQRNDRFDMFGDSPCVVLKEHLERFVMKEQDGIFRKIFDRFELNDDSIYDMARLRVVGENKTLLTYDNVELTTDALKDVMLSEESVKTREFESILKSKRALDEAIVFDFFDERFFEPLVKSYREGDDVGGINSESTMMMEVESEYGDKDSVENISKHIEEYADKDVLWKDKKSGDRSLFWNNKYWLFHDSFFYARLSKPYHVWISPLARLSNVFWNDYLRRETLPKEKTDDGSKDDRLYDLVSHRLLNLSLVLLERRDEPRKANAGFVWVKPIKMALRWYQSNKLKKKTISVVKLFFERAQKMQNSRELLSDFDETSFSRELYEFVFKEDHGRRIADKNDDRFPKSFSIYGDSFFDTLPLSMTADLSLGGFQFLNMGREQCLYVSEFFHDMHSKFGFYEIPSHYYWRHYLLSGKHKTQTFEKYVARLRKTNKNKKNEEMDGSVVENELWVLQNVRYALDAMIANQNPRNSWGYRKSYFLKSQKITRMGLEHFFERFENLEKYRENVVFNVMYYFFKHLNELKDIDSRQKRKIVETNLRTVSKRNLSKKFDYARDGVKGIGFETGKKAWFETLSGTKDSNGGSSMNDPMKETVDSARLLKLEIFKNYASNDYAIMFDEGCYAKNFDDIANIYDMMDVYTLVKNVDVFSNVIKRLGDPNGIDLNDSNYVQDLLNVYFKFKYARYASFCRYDTVFNMFLIAQKSNMVRVLSKPLCTDLFQETLKKMLKLLTDVKYEKHVASSFEGAEKASIRDTIDAQVLSSKEPLSSLNFWTKCAVVDFFSPSYTTYNDVLASGSSKDVLASKIDKNDGGVEAMQEVPAKEASGLGGFFSNFKIPSFFSRKDEEPSSFSSTDTMLGIVRKKMQNSISWKDSPSYEERQKKTRVDKESVVRSAMGTLSSRGVWVERDGEGGACDDYFFKFRNRFFIADPARFKIIANDDISVELINGYVSKIECLGSPVRVGYNESSIVEDSFIKDVLFGDRYLRWAILFYNKDRSESYGRELRYTKTSLNGRSLGFRQDDVVVSKKEDSFDLKWDVYFKFDARFGKTTIDSNLRYLLNFENVSFFPKADAIYRYEVKKNRDGKKNAAAASVLSSSENHRSVRVSFDSRTASTKERPPKRARSNVNRDGGGIRLTDVFKVFFDDLTTDSRDSDGGGAKYDERGIYSSDFSKTKRIACLGILYSVFSDYYRLFDVEMMLRYWDMDVYRDSLVGKKSKKWDETESLVLTFRHLFQTMQSTFKNEREELSKLMNLHGFDSEKSNVSKIESILRRSHDSLFESSKKIKSCFLPIDFEMYHKPDAVPNQRNRFDGGIVYDFFNRQSIYASTCLVIYEDCKKKYVLEGGYLNNLLFKGDRLKEEGKKYIAIPTCYAVLPYVEYVMTTHAYRCVRDKRRSRYDDKDFFSDQRGDRHDPVDMSAVADYDGLFCNYNNDAKHRENDSKSTKEKETLFEYVKGSSMRRFFSAKDIGDSGIIPLFCELYEDVFKSKNANAELEGEPDVDNVDFFENASTSNDCFDRLSYVGIPVSEYSLGLTKGTLSNVGNVVIFLYSRFVLFDAKKLTYDKMVNFTKGRYLTFLKSLLDKTKESEMSSFYNFVSPLLVFKDARDLLDGEIFQSNALSAFEYDMLILGCVLIMTSTVFSEHVCAFISTVSGVLFDSEYLSLLDSIYYSKTSHRNVEAEFSNYSEKMGIKEGFEESFKNIKTTIDAYAKVVFKDETLASVKPVGYRGDDIVSTITEFKKAMGIENDKRLSDFYDYFLTGMFKDDSFERYIVYAMCKLFQNTFRMIDKDDLKSSSSETNAHVNDFRDVFSRRFYAVNDVVGFLKYDFKNSDQYFFRWCDVYDDPNLNFLKKRCVRISEEKEAIKSLSKTSGVTMGKHSLFERMSIMFLNENDVEDKDAAKSTHFNDSYEEMCKAIALFVNSDVVRIRVDYLSNDFLKKFTNMHPITKDEFDLSTPFDFERYLTTNDGVNGTDLKKRLSFSILLNLLASCYASVNVDFRTDVALKKWMIFRRLYYSNYMFEDYAERFPKIYSKNFSTTLEELEGDVYFDFYSKTDIKRYQKNIYYNANLLNSTITPSVLTNFRYITKSQSYGVPFDFENKIKTLIHYSSIPLTTWMNFCDALRNDWSQSFSHEGVDDRRLFAYGDASLENAQRYHIWMLLSEACSFCVVVKSECKKTVDDPFRVVFNVTDILGFKHVLKELKRIVVRLFEEESKDRGPTGDFFKFKLISMIENSELPWDGRVKFGSRLEKSKNRLSFSRLGVLTSSSSGDIKPLLLKRTIKSHQKECLDKMIKKRGTKKDADVKLIPMVLPVGSGKTTIGCNYLDFLQKNGFLPPYVFYVTEIDAIPSLLKELWSFGLRINIVRTTSESSNMHSRISNFVDSLYSIDDGDARQRYVQVTKRFIDYDEYGNVITHERSETEDFARVEEKNMTKDVHERVFVNGKPIDVVQSGFAKGVAKKRTIKTATYASGDLKEEYVNFKPFFVNVIEYSSVTNVSESVLRKLSASKFRFCDFLKNLHENESHRWFVDLVCSDVTDDVVDSFFKSFFENDYSAKRCDDAPKVALKAFERYFGTMGYFCIFDEYHGIMRSKSSLKRSKIFSMLSFSKESVAMTGTPFANDKSAELLVPFMKHSVKYPINENNFETTINNVITSKVVSNHTKNFRVVHVSPGRFSIFGTSHAVWKNAFSDFVLKLASDDKNGKKSESFMMKSVMAFLESDDYLDACETLRQTNVSTRMIDIVDKYDKDSSSSSVLSKGLLLLEEDDAFFYVYKMTGEQRMYARDATISMRSKNSDKIYENVYVQMFLLALNEIRKGNRVMLYVRYVEHLNVIQQLLNVFLDESAENKASYDVGYRLVRKEDLDFTKKTTDDMKMTYYLGKTSFDYVDSDVESKRFGLVVLPMMQRRGFNMTACNVQVLTYFGSNTSEMEQANGRIDRTDQKWKEITYYHVLNDRLCYEYVKNIVFSQFFE